MTKQEQMIEYMIQDLVEILCEEKHIEFDVALNVLYSSQLFDKIQDPDTGLYRESPGYVYSIFEDELKLGKIVQVEV